MAVGALVGPSLRLEAIDFGIGERQGQVERVGLSNARAYQTGSKQRSHYGI